MRYRRFIHGSIFILFIIFHPLATHAKVADMKITKEEGPVDIEADQLFYERDQQLYHAHGGVEVARGSFFLKSDHARLNMATKELEAWGNVLLREGEDVLECERLEVNLDTRSGKVYKAKLFLKDQNFHITGQEAEKLGENSYRIRDGSFTTCDSARPPWKFTVKELEVTLYGHGIAKGPVFYLKDIPVFYLPVGIFPMKRERQTGFLIPRVGYSKKYGLEVKTAFFWAIAKDMDATLFLDSLGKRGFKEGLEYRYALTPDTKGQANLYFIDDKVSERNRYSFFYQHQQKFPYDFYLKWDVNHVSDRNYTRDFDEDLPSGAKLDSRSRGYLRSDLFGGKNWDQFSFLAEAEVFNDLTKESNDETVLHLPQMSFHAHPQPFFKTPFFYDVASSYTHFWRERGVRTHRGDLFPRISYPTRLFNILKVESNIGMRETLYWSDEDPTGKFKGWKSREIVEGGAEASLEFYRIYGSDIAPRVSKIYNVAKWMHTIEPTIGYRYRPRVKQKDIPTFDDLDLLPYTNQITYGFTQRLVGKPEKEETGSGSYEYARLNISHSYSLGDPFQVDSKGHERYFSNILAELWWNFNPPITAYWNAELNPYHGNFDILNGSFYFKDGKDNVFSFGYRYTKRIIQGFDFDTWIKMIKPLYLYGAIRYNLLEKMRTENIYGIEYRAQCWTLGFTIDDMNRSPDGTQKRDLKFHVYFNLMGIGSVGRKPYYMVF